MNLQNHCPVNVNAPVDATATAYDYRRTGELFVTGLFYTGPVGSLWFGTLERIVTFGGVLGVVARLTLDALVFSPLAVGGYFSFRTFLEGHFREASDEVGERRLRKLVLLAICQFHQLCSHSIFASSTPTSLPSSGTPTSPASTPAASNPSPSTASDILTSSDPRPPITLPHPRR